jgi:hypothetical protein
MENRSEPPLGLSASWRYWPLCFATHRKRLFCLLVVFVNRRKNQTGDDESFSVEMFDNDGHVFATHRSLRETSVGAV